MIIFPNGDIVTPHFDIMENAVLVDIPLYCGWAHYTFNKDHKLIKKEIWNI